MSLPAAFFHVHFGFSWLGLLTVALPLLPNIAWALTPSHHREGPVVYCGRFWELAETVTRLLFILGFIWLANRHFTQFLLPAAAGIFLTFYYFRWILGPFTRNYTQTTKRELLTTKKADDQAPGKCEIFSPP